jgi:translation initiation factor IF-1
MSGRFMQIGIQHIKFKDREDKIKMLEGDHIKISKEMIQRYSEK